MKRSYFIIVLFLTFVKVTSQEKQQSAKEMMLEAESNFLYEEFSEALPLYLKLLKADPENNNLNFKIGVCYLNIPHEKEKSIQYLEKAVKDISLEYKPNSIEEKHAPLDAYFYLGSAYRVNNQLDAALKAYAEFQSKLDPAVYDEEIVVEQIRAIDRAKKLESSPIFYDVKNLGELINSRFAESNAVVSADDSTLVYNVKLQFYDALYYSKKINNEWSAPINIIPELGVDGDVYSTCLSIDGKELFLYRNDNYDGNLYSSRLNNGKWSPIKKLNDEINTKYWESHASLSPDGKTLYFTSNRKGSLGGLDIYKATRDNTSLDNWKNVINLGPEVNSPFNEETPFISEDGKTLFFSSYGHFNMGGYDIFYSTLLDNGKWSIPLNMGYPLNTTDDDIFFMPINNGTFAYICRYYPDNYGRTDVLRVELYSDQHPRKFLIKGIVGIPTELTGQIRAQLVNKTSHDTIDFFEIDPLNPKFNKRLSAGKYELIVSGDGVYPSSEEFTLRKDQPNSEITIRTDLKAIPQEIEQETQIQEKIENIFDKSFFKVYNAKSIQIALNLPKGTKVALSVYKDSTLIRKENFDINKIDYKYNYVPFVGKNILKFEAITPDNRTASGEVIVIYDNVSDTLSQQELALALAEKQRNLNYTKGILSNMAKGELKNILEKTDIYKENISSLDELVALLKNQAQFFKINPAEIDSLINEYKINQPIAARLFMYALRYLLNDTYKPVIDSIIGTKAENTVESAIKDIISSSEGREEFKLNLLSASSKIADAGSAYYYYEALKRVTKGRLRALLDTLNINRERINTPEDLLEYLLNKSAKARYSQNDVYKAFLVIPAYTASPAELLNSMTDKADGELKDFLKHININEKQIKTTSELGLLLFERAKAAKISFKDLIKLLIKVNSDYHFKQIIKDLNMFATDTIKALLDKINLKENNINSTSELMNYILSNFNDKRIYNELITVFSHIGSKNLLHAAASKSGFKKEPLITPFNIGLFSIFFLLLFIMLFFIFRSKKEKEI